MPGMVYASVEHPPVLGQKLNPSTTRRRCKFAGVNRRSLSTRSNLRIAFKPLGGVAVIADNTWAAFPGTQEPEDRLGHEPNAVYNSDDSVRCRNRRPPARQVVRNVGDVDAEFAKAARSGGRVLRAASGACFHGAAGRRGRISRRQSDGLGAHAESASRAGDGCSVLGIKKEDVTCHVTLLGGGFGRKSKPDHVAEAAVLSKQLGKPVKVVWSREDDIRFDFYHSVAAMYMKAAVGRWQADGLAAALGVSADRSTFDVNRRNTARRNGPGLERPSVRYSEPPAENGPAEAHVRIGWLRSVANIYHAFAVESFADELAQCRRIGPRSISAGRRSGRRA